MRILEFDRPQQLREAMEDIRVDPYGIKIMLPKAGAYLVRLNAVSNITANILKQEMLSLGADVAVARGSLTGKVKKTDCLLMGNLSQYCRLSAKLNKQPFGLDELAKELLETLKNYQRDKFCIEAGRFKLRLGSRTAIMGIVNATPDSFSGDGLYLSNLRTESSLAYAVACFAQIQERLGADIIDIGGESSRPGAKPVELKQELRRVIPAIKIIVKKAKIPISIDTSKPEVARQALDSGAVMVNDISGLRNPAMLKIISRYKAAAVVMHMKGNPRTMQKNPRYCRLIDEISAYLHNALIRAKDHGILEEKIIIDPGIGFGKTAEDNLTIIKHLREFKVLGRPILIGTSRKAFIGKILKTDPQNRVFGTVSSCVAAAMNGAQIVRVHDVKEVKQSLAVTDAINYS